MTQRQLALFQTAWALAVVDPAANDDPRDTADTVAALDPPPSVTDEGLVSDLQNLEALAIAVTAHMDAQTPFGPRLPRGALVVPCPKCLSSRGLPCIDRTNQPTSSHAIRFVSAMDPNDPLPLAKFYW
jgi:hypothetical protein